MQFEILNHSNWMMYAAKNYTNSECISDDEFLEDLNRCMYIKRLFKKYEESGELRERLILNHLIILTNTFGPTAATRLLFFKLDGYYPLLKTFLEFLGFLPEKIDKIGLPPKDINTLSIVSDLTVLERLKSI